MTFAQVTSGEAIVFGFIQSLLELYLETFELRFASKHLFSYIFILLQYLPLHHHHRLFSVTSVGLCFLGHAFAYTLFTILAGILTDSKVKVLLFMMMTTMTFCHHHNLQPWTMNVFGLFTSVVSFYLLAPEPYFPVKPHLATTIVSLLLHVPSQKHHFQCHFS